MTKTWLQRRMTHTCSIARDIGTARSSSGMVVASGTSVATSQACRFVEQSERDASESGANVTRFDALLLFPNDASVQVKDMVHTIVLSGTAVAAGTYTIGELLKRRDWRGKSYHLSAGLERIDTR
jgi:hypothetical protein